MQTLAQIEFDGMTASAELRAAIHRHVLELEKRYDRVTVGRIAVKGPGDRHRAGGQYHVSVQLALPDGREVHVNHTPPQDDRYADLTFAVDEAFKRARRQLQDQAQIMRGDIKHHARS